MRIESIRGGQTTQPIPIQQNNAKPECIRVRKLYDWVGVPVEEHIVTDIPPNCLPQVLSVKNLEIFCCPLPLNNSHHQSEVISIRRDIPGLPKGVALVSMCCTFLIRLALVDWDNPECPICCIEAPVTFKVKRTVLCLPEPLGKEHICCEVICCEAHGIVINGELEIQLNLSLGIRVETEVILELVGKFCQPRLPISVPQTLCWPEVNVPSQCSSFFPPECCDTIGITLFGPPTAACSGQVTGAVTCNGAPAAGAEVMLSATGTVTFSPNPAVTNAAGMFMSIATTMTSGASTSTITASATVCGDTESATLDEVAFFCI